MKLMPSLTLCRMIKPKHLHYISPHGTKSWLVRVPVAFFHDNNVQTVRHKQKSFPFLRHGGKDAALLKAKEFRDLNIIVGLTYAHRSASAGNGRQVRHKNRKRGADLPAGICESVAYKKTGRVERTIVAQASCGKVRRSRSYMYGHSRTREEAVALAHDTLNKFLTEIEESNESSEKS